MLDSLILLSGYVVLGGLSLTLAGQSGLGYAWLRACDFRIAEPRISICRRSPFF
jgi:predicted flavoprotein YhiN